MTASWSPSNGPLLWNQVGLSISGQLSPIMRNYVPNLVVIDRNWVIRAQYAGDDPFFHDSNKNLRALVDSLLKEPATKKGRAKKK